MKHISTLLGCFLITGMPQLKASILDIRPETLIFPTHIHNTNKRGNIKRTIIGKFYNQEDNPVIEPHLKSNNPLTPFALLSEILYISKYDEFTRLPELYSPKTKAIVTSGLKDEISGPAVRNWMKSLKRFIVLGMWIESPNQLIIYVKTNDASGDVFPYLFEFLETRWYLCAGKLAPELSNEIDNFYANYSSHDMAIIFPHRQLTPSLY